MNSYDGLRLHAWLFDPDCVSPAPHAYAICVHGYTGEPAEMAKWAHRYARLGFTVLVPAQRAHELSEGRYVGMGWLERNDLLSWIRLITDSDAEAKILLYGGSMGASTVMNTVGDPRLPRNVVAGIAESGFASARDEFMDMAHSMFHLPRLAAAACVDAAGLICKRRAGYDFTEASCLKSLRRTVIPMLFIHGGRRQPGKSEVPRHELCRMLEHRSGETAGPRRQPHGKLRHGSRPVLAHGGGLRPPHLQALSIRNVAGPTPIRLR